MPPLEGKRLSDQTLAVTAEVLFLVNLLALPGLAFVALLWLWRTEKNRDSALVRCHLGQAVRVSLWGGAILVLAGAAMLLAGGFHQAWTWVAVMDWDSMAYFESRQWPTSKRMLDWALSG